MAAFESQGERGTAAAETLMGEGTACITAVKKNKSFPLELENLKKQER